MQSFLNKKSIDDLDLKDKKVLVRVDYNVPIQNGQITSTKRIKSTLPTIRKIIEEGGKTILFSHLGRVKSEKDLTKKSLRIVAEELANELGQEIIFVPVTRGEELEQAVESLQAGEVLLVENTRFEDLNNKAESKNVPELGKYWASLGDVFINDAFGTLHREHASNVGIAQHIQESAIGYLVENELKALTKLIDNPKRPFVAIVGGAKISDKIGIISSLLEKADKVLIAGGMSYTFKKALGFEIGISIVEDDKIELANELLEKYWDKIILPIDNAMAYEFKDTQRLYNTRFPLQILKDAEGLDIGPWTLRLFRNELKGAHTVLWNGTLGVAEFSNFKWGTEAVAKEISKLENAYTVIGGGDSVAAVEANNLQDNFSHISTGGGASITFIEKADLVGLHPIQEK
ncbi:phosphoglycerate kinase [Mesomycoplasma hyorhinis]|uniref:phosphoglycerate kinase n=1 Tax=Mesomycoplasma hyorhinis TaxID=2100 RepID=UPI001C05DDF0|nr:phosphoglycerate kinase [Mesomycoplasma hyorhinis]